MDNFMRCILICVLIVLSHQSGKQSVNYEPILEKVQSNFKKSFTSEAVLVFEKKYEEMVARLMGNDENPKWAMLLDDTHSWESVPSPESLHNSLTKGIDYAVAIGTSFDPVGLMFVIDEERFSDDVLKLVESQWITPTVVQFYGSRDSMEITYPCSLDSTSTYISAVIENNDITTGEAIQIEWKYDYHAPEKGECLVVSFANFDIRSKQWEEFFNGSDYREKITLGVMNYNEVFFNQPATVDVKVNRFGMITEGNGLEYRFIDYLGKKTDLSFIPKPYEFGAKDAKSMEAWTVLPKMMDEKQIDVAIARIPTTDQLIETHAYSKIYFTEYYYILSTTFASSDYIFAVFQPLRLKVWALLLLMIFLCGPLFLTMVYFTSKPDPIFNFSSDGLMNSYFHTYRLFFGHATWSHHFNFSFNLFVLAWLGFGLMLIVGYNSTFTASISSGKSKWEINDVADLMHGVKKGYVNLVLSENLDGRGPFKEHLIKKNSIYDKIMSTAKRRNKVRYLNLHAENLPQLLGEEDAVIADLTTSYFLLRTLKDKNFRISQQSIGSEQYAIFARKGFRYVDRFDHIIRDLDVSGSFLGWFSEAMKFKNKIQFHGNTIEGTIMQLEHIYGAYVVFCIGVVLAVFALISEVIYKRCKDHRD